MTNAPTKSLRCEQCGAELLNEEDLRRHMAEEHPMPASRDEEVEEASRESFPASDPPSNSPVTGTGSPEGLVEAEDDDGMESAESDSFPASDAPSTSPVTGSGTPKSGAA